MDYADALGITEDEADLELADMGAGGRIPPRRPAVTGGEDFEDARHGPVDQYDTDYDAMGYWPGWDR